MIFQLNFLKGFVPFDRPELLRAHISPNIFCPRGCAEILQDFVHLVRARLHELNLASNNNSPTKEKNICNKIFDPKVSAFISTLAIGHQASASSAGWLFNKSIFFIVFGLSINVLKEIKKLIN